MARGADRGTGLDRRDRCTCASRNPGRVDRGRDGHFAAIVPAAAAAVGLRHALAVLLTARSLRAHADRALILKAGPLDGGAITPRVVFGLNLPRTALPSNSRQKTRRSRRSCDVHPRQHRLDLARSRSSCSAPRVVPRQERRCSSRPPLTARSRFALWVRSQRELGTLLGAIALAAVAVGVADILSGSNLAYTFAAEGAVSGVRRTEGA